MRSPQSKFFKESAKAYGGELLKKRKAREHGRPLSTRNTMHLVLRSSQAKGEWSFRNKENHEEIAKVVRKFSLKYGIQILKLANVGNHLHFQIKLSNIHTYKRFIKAITSAIVMKITKTNKFNKLEKKFWDYRPFTRVIVGLRDLLSIKNYIEINELEGLGYNRMEAFDILEKHKKRFAG